MPDDKSIPATKADIELLFKEIAKVREAGERQALRMLAATDKWRGEIVNHIDVRFESLRHDITALQGGGFGDFLAIQQDKLGDFDARISRLEQRGTLTG
jgi:hypothetical protein